MTRATTSQQTTEAESPSVADILAAVLAELDTGELDVTKQGRAFLAGAEAACRVLAGG